MNPQKNLHRLEMFGKIKAVDVVLNAASHSANWELPLREAINVWVARSSEEEKLQSVNEKIGGFVAGQGTVMIRLPVAVQSAQNLIRTRSVG